MFCVPEKYRVRTGDMASDESYGNNGRFLIKTVKFKRPITVIASDGAGWEHVSVSLPDHCPTWEEMSFIRSLFWAKGDLVVQLHPPESNYVNDHPFCLHLWRKSGTNDFCELPSVLLV